MSKKYFEVIDAYYFVWTGTRVEVDIKNVNTLSVSGSFVTLVLDKFFNCIGAVTGTFGCWCTLRRSSSEVEEDLTMNKNGGSSRYLYELLTTDAIKYLLIMNTYALIDLKNRMNLSLYTDF